MNKPIGIIDSGVGGLTVTKEVMRQLPNEEIYYVGDTKRCPYGPRNPEEVKKFTWQLTNFLLTKDIKMLIIACNTATAVALDEIQEKLSIPVIGVISPGARTAIKVTKSKKIGVLGTDITIKTKAYEQALKDISSDVTVQGLACPKFVPLVESGQFTGELIDRIVFETLEDFSKLDMDTLILGCTHYPHLETSISKVMGDSIKIISSGDETACEASAILHHQKMLRKKKKAPNHRFYTTGSVKTFKYIADTWLDDDFTSVYHIDLKDE